METWCPPGMEIEQPRAAYEWSGEASLRGMAKDEPEDAAGIAEDADGSDAGWIEEVPFADEGEMEPVDA